MEPRRAMWIFIVTALFVTINDRLVFVIFPTFLIENKFSATQIGLIFSVAAIVLVVLRAVIGKLSDMYGRKRTMSLGLLINSVAVFFYPHVSKIYEYAIVKSVDEVSNTLKSSVEESIHADAFPRKTRPQYLIKLGKAFPLSRAIAAILGILITTYLSLAYGFYAAAISMFVAFIIFTLFYHEKRNVNLRLGQKINPFAYGKKFKFITVVGFITSLVFSLMYLPAFFILGETVLGLKANDIFLLLLVSYIVSTALIHFAERKAQNFGKKPILIIILICYAAFSFLYAFANLVLFIIALMGIAFSYYFWRIAFKTVKMELAHPGARGEQLGFSKTTEGIGDILGPLAGGLLIDAVSIQAPFILGGLLYLVTAAIIARNI